ncbi:hypothetical protein TVVG_00017 [Tetraselmis viridis virus SI1]|uniref:tail terminator n=1 Tax=Tetraselmis viridis virus S20 TaxID=754070 RepID=UPI0002C1075C|nr:tail terminator [Tetraselmis viridis virus S20]AGH31366.1 hypothetical protein TVGG_00038 [Tetraselmis viridis virus S20]AGH31400.1 hypothetical protein TVVG_00017 [Tetraselmis viridis virus SI1]
MTDVIIVIQNAMAADSGILGLMGGEDRIYPIQAPDAPDYPYVVLTRISGMEETDFEGDTGTEEARVQIDCYALGYADMVELKDAVRDFMVQRPPPGPPCVIDMARCINDRDLANPGTERAGPRIRRRLLEFSVWTRRR